MKKGAFDEAEADRRFNEWLTNKEEQIEARKSGLEKKGEETRKQRLEAETTVKETRAAAYAKKLATLAAEAEAAAKALVAPEAPEATEAEAVAETAADVADVAAEPVAEAEAPVAEEKNEASEETEKTQE